MRTPPVNWENLMAQPHQTETRVDINNVSYYGYDGESGIWSLATHNALFENFSVGNCHAGTIDITLVNPQEIPTMAKMEVYARLKDEQFKYEQRSVTNQDSQARTNTVYYSNALEEIDGVMELKEPVYTVNISYNLYSNLSVLRGKYWQLRVLGRDRLNYSPSDANYTRAARSVFGVRTYYTYIDGWSPHFATEWVRKGVYYIDTREWDAQHEFLTITGYDAMLKAEQPYYKPPVTIIGWPKVDTTVVSEICTRLGVELDTRTVLNKGYMVQLPAVSTDGEGSDTLRTTLGYIGAAYGGNWIITDEGKLRLVPLKSGATPIALGTSGVDLQTFPAYDALGIVRVIVSEEAEYTAGTTGRDIEIYCPWGTQTMANNLLTALSGYVYQPLTITTEYAADPLWELGDNITFNSYTSVIAGIAQNFSLAYTADISAPNGEEIEHEYPFIDKATQEIRRTVARATASLRVGLDNIEGIVSGIAKPYQSGTQYERYAVVYKDGKYYQCNVSESSPTWVASEWQEQSSGALSSIIKQTMDSITLSAVAGANHSTITIRANGIEVDSKVVTFSSIVADSIVANSMISAPSIYGGVYYNANGQYHLKLSDAPGEYGLVINRGTNELFGVYDGDFDNVGFSAKGSTFLTVDTPYPNDVRTYVKGRIGLKAGVSYGSSAQREALAHPFEGMLWFDI